MTAAPIHPTDTLQPGDTAELVRTWGDGTCVRLRLKVRRLTRFEDVQTGPRWCFEADDPDPDRAGVWAIGCHNGVTTTLLPTEAS